MLPTPPPTPTLATCVAPEDRLGFLLANRLRLDTILGVGAYGTVYTAQDVYTGQEYAVKALNKVGLDARQRRFQQMEIQLHHKASHHPNIVSLIQIMEAEDTTYVVMEYCPEGDLFASITEQLFYVGNDELVRKAFLQVLDAVQFCHSIGIYHRDLKPENVLCSNGGHTLKLADFGLATTDRYTSDYGCGSTFYMSSECQVSSPAAQSCYASAPNDVWALGVILVNLTCGRNPWKRASVEDPTFRAFLKDPHFLSTILPISDELEAILRRVFDPNPMTRITLQELRSLIVRCAYLTAQPRCQVSPPTPPPSDYDPVEPSYQVASPCQVFPPSPPQSESGHTSPIHSVFGQPEERPAPVVFPPTPPHTPPAAPRFSAPSAASSPPSLAPGCASQPPLTPDAPRPSLRMLFNGVGPNNQCSQPLIGTDLFAFQASTGCWTRPAGFHSTSPVSHAIAA